MLRQTILYKQHQKAGAHFVDFSGWEMPLHYGSQLEEHHHVRRSAGLFDVSHMGVLDVSGPDAVYFLRYLLANDIQKITPGRALYSCMLNADGGVIDDLIVYQLADMQYRIVVNAATREKDIAWMVEQSDQFDVAVVERPDFAIIAIQGPKALEIAQTVFKSSLTKPLKEVHRFQFVVDENCLLARTGYTGEDGLEIVLPQLKAVDVWKKLISQGAKPCGLGARDTLRLEAGLNLYGSDMDETTTPLNSNLAWTVSWNDPTRDFIGRDALKKQLAEGIHEQLVGLVMEEPGVLRNHQKVYMDGNGEGEITSGSFSPTMGHAIALARVPIDVSGNTYVDRRGKQIPVKIVKPPFVRQGKKLI